MSGDKMFNEVTCKLLLGEPKSKQALLSVLYKINACKRSSHSPRRGFNGAHLKF